MFRTASLKLGAGLIAIVALTQTAHAATVDEIYNSLTPEEKSIVDREVAACAPRCRLVAENNYLVIDHDEAPSRVPKATINRHDKPPSVVRKDSTGTYKLEDRKYQGFGNSDVGIFYGNRSYVDWRDSRLNTIGEVWLEAKLFGYRFDLFSTTADAVETRGSISNRGTVSVLGKKYDTHSTSGYATQTKSVTKTFYEKEKWFWAGPVPFRIKGKILGTAGSRAYAQSSKGYPLRTWATVEPWISIDANATGGPDIAVLAAGIGGDINLLHYATPSVTKAAVNGDRLDWSVSRRRTLKTLAGRLYVWARVGVPRIKKLQKKWEETIVSWSGLTLANSHYGNSGVVAAETTIVNLGGGLCLDLRKHDLYKDGGKVQMWGCNGQVQQQWVLNAKGQIVNGAGKCLNLAWIGGNGTPVNSYRCYDGFESQMWRFNGTALINKATGLCLDVHAPAMRRNGAKVQLWQCNGSPQQSWIERT